MIEEYKFGLIRIDGQTFNHDVEVRWSGKVFKWWREESHVIDLGDIKGAINEKPDMIIIGTGAYGIAKVTERAKQAVKAKDIELVIDNTTEAVRTFNICLEESEEEQFRKVIGLFHLTC